MVDISQFVVNNTEYNVADDTKVPYDLLRDTVGFTSKNLIPFPYYDIGDFKKAGVTTVVNRNGSISFEGTTTAAAWFEIYLGENFLTDKYGILSGCPTGGGGSKWEIQLRFQDALESNNTTDIIIGNYTDNETIIPPSTKPYLKIACVVRSGQTVTNFAFHPMLRHQNVFDATFEVQRQNIVSQDFISKTKNKNLLPIRNNVVSVINNGITWTVNRNSEGQVESIVATGTNTNQSGDSVIAIVMRETNANSIYKGGNVLSGCPAGGSPDTYNLVYRVGTAVSDSYKYTRRDFGNGVVLPNINDEELIRINCTIGPGYTCPNDGIVFRPMITEWYIDDQTFEPYKSEFSENSILGATNLISFPYNNNTRTENGITFTVQEDYGIDINGTSTADASFRISTFREITKDSFPYPVFLSGMPLNTDLHGAYINFRIGDKSTGTFKRSLNDNGTGVLIPQIGDDEDGSIQIIVPNGKTINHLVVYPMLCLESDKNSGYIPPAYTNLEITKRIGYTKIHDVDLNDITKTATYYLIGNITNSPGGNYGVLEVINAINPTTIMQIYFPEGDVGAIYKRRFYNGAWESWYKFTGTAVS